MSSRVIRKLRNEFQSSEAAIAKEDEEISEEEEIVEEIKSKFNPFSLLEDEAENVENDEEGDENPSDNLPVSSQTKSSTKKKNRNKKNKSKSSSSSQLDADGDDVLFQPVSKVKTASKKDFEKNKKPALWIEARYFDAESEMKTLFSTAKPSFSLNRQKIPKHLSRSRIVKPRAHWPPLVRLGISMERADDGTFYIKYSNSYEAVQQLFEMAVQSVMVDEIQRILLQDPYHLEALLQLSEIQHVQEDFNVSAELVERLLYAVEAVSHHSFNWSTGECRMKYEIKENRALFVALFRRLCFLGRRTCYRTALEFTKALLSLNPIEDPLFAILLVDFFALKCEMYDWLLQFIQEMEELRSLKSFPNIAFSSALALFHLSVQSGEEKDLEKANAKLQDALMRFPSVLMQMLTALTLEPDDVVRKSQYFNLHSIAAESVALPYMQKHYVTVTNILWRDSAVVDWLAKNVHVVLARVEREQDLVNAYKKDRQSKYVNIPVQLRRHLFLLKASGYNVEFPPDLGNQEILSFDPFPPEGSARRHMRFQLSDNTALNFILSFLPNFDPQNPPEYNSLAELIQDFFNFNNAPPQNQNQGH